MPLAALGRDDGIVTVWEAKLALEGIEDVVAIVEFARIVDVDIAPFLLRQTDRAHLGSVVQNQPKHVKHCVIAVNDDQETWLGLEMVSGHSDRLDHPAARP